MKPRRSTIGESQSKAAHLNFTIYPTTTQSWKDFLVFSRPDSRVVNSWLLSLFLNHQIFVSCQRDYQCIAQHDISFCWKQHFYHPTVLQFTSPEECYIICVYNFLYIYLYLYLYAVNNQQLLTFAKGLQLLPVCKTWMKQERGWHTFQIPSCPTPIILLTQLIILEDLKCYRY